MSLLALLPPSLPPLLTRRGSSFFGLMLTCCRHHHRSLTTTTFNLKFKCKHVWQREPWTRSKAPQTPNGREGWSWSWGKKPGNREKPCSYLLGRWESLKFAGGQNMWPTWLLSAAFKVKRWELSNSPCVGFNVHNQSRKVCYRMRRDDEEGAQSAGPEPYSPWKRARKESPPRSTLINRHSRNADKYGEIPHLKCLYLALKVTFFGG